MATNSALPFVFGPQNCCLLLISLLMLALGVMFCCAGPAA